MKVYELSKKYNVSDKAMIKVLRSLKVQEEKELNSFTSLSLKDIKIVEMHFLKQDGKENIDKKNNLNQNSGLVIVKKGKDEIIKENIPELPEFSKPIKKNIEEKSDNNNQIQNKKPVRVSKKVLVKKIKKDFPQKETPAKINEVSKDVKTTSDAPKRDKSPDNKKFTQKFKDDKSIQKKYDKKPGANKDKNFIQINKFQKPQTPTTDISAKESRLKDDHHWKKKVNKWDKDSYKDQKQEKEIFFQKKKQKEPIKISPVPKSIEIMETITVSELAKKLNIKAGEIITKLISMGVMATINQVIDSETATIVANEYHSETKIVSLYDETVIEDIKDNKEDLVPRPPIVTVMGHVDHGKTKLLDAIRESDVAGQEMGGITQHIGAYQIRKNDQTIVFLDTPGHEAFTAMRARGAKVTDIVILVVAANDGVMPQTIEAYNHAKEANVPIVVAINKIDSLDANPDRVKQQLADLGLLAEEWGGKTMMIEVSALKKMNLDKLLEAVLLEAELLELKANPSRKAIGTIIESKVDIGRGAVATVLINNGTLKVGDPFVSGIYSGKVRALFSDRGAIVDSAPPSTPVEVLGLDGVPQAGDPFNVLSDEKIAKQYAQKRQELQRVNKAKDVKKITLDDISRQIRDGEIKDFKIVLKGDVQGSIEAIKDSFEKLSNNEVSVKVIHSSTGAINESDVMLASASNAIIVGFHVHPNSKALQLAMREHVEIRKHAIIYDAIDSIKNAIQGLLAPELREEITGQAQVRELFKIPKVGTIAGCYVTSGKLSRQNKIRVIRDGNEVFDGEMASLKRFKEDTGEVKETFECGISIVNFQDLKVDDVIEGYLIREIAKVLK